MVLDYYRLVEECTQAAPCILEIYWIEYFKMVYLIIYNCAYKTSFCKSSQKHSVAYFYFTIQEKTPKCVSIPIVYQSAFIMACFWDLSDIHMCVCVVFKWLHLIRPCRQPVGNHHRLASNICLWFGYILWHAELKIWSFKIFELEPLPLRGYSPPRLVCLCYWLVLKINYLQWWIIQPAIHVQVCQLK